MTHEIWINPDGSGKLKMELRLSKEMTEFLEQAQAVSSPGDGGGPYEVEKMKKKLSANPNVTSVSVEESTEGDTKFIAYTIGLKDITDFSSVQGPRDADVRFSRQWWGGEKIRRPYEVRETLKRELQGFRGDGGECGRKQPDSPRGTGEDAR